MSFVKELVLKSPVYISMKEFSEGDFTVEDFIKAIPKNIILPKKKYEYSLLYDYLNIQFLIDYSKLESNLRYTRKAEDMNIELTTDFIKTDIDKFICKLYAGGYIRNSGATMTMYIKEYIYNGYYCYNIEATISASPTHIHFHSFCDTINIRFTKYTSTIQTYKGFSYGGSPIYKSLKSEFDDKDEFFILLREIYDNLIPGVSTYIKQQRHGSDKRTSTKCCEEFVLNDDAFLDFSD